MIDSLWIVTNSLWVCGGATMLAASSWASWRASRVGCGLRVALASTAAGLWVDVGVLLVAASLVLSARTAFERVIWVAFALFLAFRASRTAATAGANGAGVRPAAAAQRDHATTRASGPLEAVADAIERLEPAFLLFAAPFLLFPVPFTPWLVLLIMLPWLARGYTSRRLSDRSPLDGPVLALLAMLVVSLLVSADRPQSMPKFYGVVLGIAVFFAFVNHVRSPRHAAVASLGIAMAGLAVSAVALAGTSWPGMSGPLLPAGLRWIPGVMSRLGGSNAAGFNANEVAGAMCLFIPLLASLWMLGFGSRTRGDQNRHLAEGIADAGILQALLGFTLLLMLVNLVLAGSRSALLGVAAALLVLAVFSRRRSWQLLALSLLLGALAWRGLGMAQVLDPLFLFGGVRNVQARIELWNRAIYMLQDFAFTGVGLNRYSATANALYPLITVAPERVLLLTHAHNVFLQVAVDLGIPGLVAYLALLMSSFAAWRAASSRLPGGSLQAMGVGSLCSLIGYHVYGLGDCVALGAKPGLALWAVLGLLASLANLAFEPQGLGSLPTGS